MCFKLHQILVWNALYSKLHKNEKSVDLSIVSIVYFHNSKICKIFTFFLYVLEFNECSFAILHACIFGTSDYIKKNHILLNLRIFF
jgi:hypothetical protein